MAYDVTYNADFNILATITAPLFKSTDPNIKLDTNATLSLANLVASHINRRYKAVPTKVGAATVRLDSAYGLAPIQEFVKEKVANGYIYSVRFNNGANHGYEFSPLFDKLADIIDPTCRIYYTDTSYDTPDTGYVSDGYYACSRCGELNDSSQYAWDDFQASYYEGEPPFEYCPHCGARIVIDEPRKDDDAER